MRFGAPILLLFWAAASSSVGQDAPDESLQAWRNWRWSRPLQTEPAAERRLVRVRLPFAACSKANASLDDLRIIDETGREVPFALEARTGETSRQWRASRISEISYVPGEYTQVLVDTGEGDALHNSLSLESEKRDFFALLEVSASDDQQVWRILSQKAPVYRFQEEGLSGNQSAEYPETRSRWVRLRIREQAEQFPVAEVRIGYAVREPPELDEVAVPLQTLSASQESGWEAEFPEAMPLAGVRFDVPEEDFHRPVIVQAGDNRDTLAQVAEGEIYRYRSQDEGEPERVRSSLQFEEIRRSVWRVRVLNRADHPLPNLQPSLLGAVRWLVFRQEPGKSYRLLYGNSLAPAASYDLGIVTRREERLQALTVSAGPERENPGYVSPEPWTERHPLTLWVVLAMAVGVLAWLAVKSLSSRD